MRNIVKYCCVCEEGFSEKFSFCPNCASTLTAHEISPPATEPTQITNQIETTKTFLVTGVNEISPKGGEYNGDNPPPVPKTYDDGVYHLALVDNKNNSVRNLLLLGAFVFVMLGGFGAMVVSLFASTLNVGSINDDNVIAYLSSLDPDAIDEPEVPVVKQKKKSGGGGGGGDEDPNPASKGRDAKMLENPLTSPSVKLDTVTDPELKLEPAVKGPQVPYKEDKTQPYGVKSSIYTVPSDGPGANNGQGNGRDGGQGPGTGPGIGPGSDGGRGGGYKGGIGPDGGPDIGGRPDDDKNTPPPIRKEVIAMKILAKPKAVYTDAARQEAVQGTVVLRVTFLASGSIGNITVVSGLSGGLTEQAIAAARNMKFEPQKINGVAQTVVKQVQYSFTLF